MYIGFWQLEVDQKQVFESISVKILARGNVKSEEHLSTIKDKKAYFFLLH